jgi:putative addiction module component (TIGR02574 family)
MGSISKAEILKLSVSERILLVEDIWDSIAEAPEEIALSEAQEHELDARLDAYHRNPTEGSPWAMVRDRIRAGRAS